VEKVGSSCFFLLPSPPPFPFPFFPKSEGELKVMEVMWLDAFKLIFFPFSPFFFSSFPFPQVSDEGSGDDERGRRGLLSFFFPSFFFSSSPPPFLFKKGVRRLKDLRRLLAPPSLFLSFFFFFSF